MKTRFPFFTVKLSEVEAFRFPFSIFWWLSLPKPRFPSSLFLLTFYILLASCTNSDIQAKQVKSLDSISGSLNQKIIELQKADTLILEKALTKFNNYKQFIKQNINDTVTKKEADAVQQFFISGNNLESFFMNRKSILARANLVNTQLSKLIVDVNQSAFEPQQLNEFIFAEKEQANDVIQKSFMQQQLFNTNLQQFKNALPLVEELIKTKNNGQLPTIVKDTTAL